MPSPSGVMRYSTARPPLTAARVGTGPSSVVGSSLAAETLRPAAHTVPSSDRASARISSSPASNSVLATPSAVTR